MYFSFLCSIPFLLSQTSASPVDLLQRNVETGTLVIMNKCAFNVFYMVTGSTDSDVRILGPCGSVSDKYRERTDGGFSGKMSNSSWNVHNGVDQLQFEYTVNRTSGLIYWDLSAINLNGVFVKQGFNATTSDSTCQDRTCHAGDWNCYDAYQKPSDDHATTACGLNSNITVVLCSEG